MKRYVDTVCANNCTIELDTGERYTFNSCCGDGLHEILAQLAHVHKLKLKVINMMCMHTTEDADVIEFLNDEQHAALKSYLKGGRVGVCCPHTTYFITGVVLTKIHSA